MNATAIDYNPLTLRELKGELESSLRSCKFVTGFSVYAISDNELEAEVDTRPKDLDYEIGKELPEVISDFCEDYPSRHEIIFPHEWDENGFIVVKIRA